MHRIISIVCSLLLAALVLPLLGSRSAELEGTTSYQRVSFKELKRYVPGRPVPPEIAALNGKNVEVLGFMAALTQLDDIDQFVLASVPPLNCYCAPPLFINELAHVRMNRTSTSYKGGVVRVKGKLIINTRIKDEFNDVMYTIKADVVE